MSVWSDGGSSSCPSSDEGDELPPLPSVDMTWDELANELRVARRMVASARRRAAGERRRAESERRKAAALAGASAERDAMRAELHELAAAIVAMETARNEPGSAEAELLERRLEAVSRAAVVSGSGAGSGGGSSGGTDLRALETLEEQLRAQQAMQRSLELSRASLEAENARLRRRLAKDRLFQARAERAEEHARVVDGVLAHVVRLARQAGAADVDAFARRAPPLVLLSPVGVD